MHKLKRHHKIIISIILIFSLSLPLFCVRSNNVKAYDDTPPYSILIGLITTLSYLSTLHDTAGQIEKSKINEVLTTFQQYLENKGIRDKADKQLAAVQNDYNINLTLNWNLVSGDVIKTLYEAISAVFNPSPDVSQDVINGVVMPDLSTSGDNLSTQSFNYWGSCVYNSKLFLFFYAYNPGFITSVNNMFMNNNYLQFPGKNLIYRTDSYSSSKNFAFVMYSVSDKLYYNSDYGYNVTSDTSYPLANKAFYGGRNFYNDGMYINNPDTFNVLSNFLLGINTYNRPSYALPNTIDQDIINQYYNDDSEIINITNLPDLTYNYNTQNYTYNDNDYTIINSDYSAPEPEPTPTPEVTPTPSPLPSTGGGGSESADLTHINQLLDFIYERLSNINDDLNKMADGVHNDLTTINDSLKNITSDSKPGTLNPDDATEQAGLIKDITALIKAVLEFLKGMLVPTLELDLDSLNTKPPDLLNRFPFSMAGDIVRVFTIFNAPAQAPVLVLDFDISMIGGGVIPLTLDFRQFDQYASIFRQLTFLSFAISLIWMSFKMFMGGGDSE